MKSIATFLCCLVPLAAVNGQEAQAPTKKEVPAFMVEFSNLPKEDREKFEIALAEAQKLFNQKRVFEAIVKAEEASKIFKDRPEIHNILGACQVEFRNFDKAMEHFKEADRLAPNESSIVFNIAELDFVTKNWESAEKNLEKVLTLVSKASGQEDLQVARLVEFKLLLCKLKLDKKAEAVSMSKKYDYLDDSPYPYFADAAIAFSEGREVDAEGEMARAVRIFQNPALLAAWQDTMMEYGYIKGFFGGDVAEPAAAK
ncbi:hypothetical protein OKA04_14695 [Luteolibacter flavescens]|uniref:Tetratricopeptide repeat protein n=1 Tax=Luteolibacter flavescens TaxID=1859460 RepID=A0ABT3FSM5_9BACT|nr:hypothetical protein [Luteolibacter flavescens]MCW1885985.1 hypothetical protein [Luteolibacter flavescens]